MKRAGVRSEASTMSDTSHETLVEYIRVNLARMVDARGTRRDMAALLDIHPSQLTRILRGDQGWATLEKLENKLIAAGFDTMSILGPKPALLGLVDHLGQRDMYLVGRLLMLVGSMEAGNRRRWLEIWVDAAELAMQGPLPPPPE